MSFYLYCQNCSCKSRVSNVDLLQLPKKLKYKCRSCLAIHFLDVPNFNTASFVEKECYLNQKSEKTYFQLYLEGNNTSHFFISTSRNDVKLGARTFIDHNMICLKSKLYQEPNLAANVIHKWNIDIQTSETIFIKKDNQSRIWINEIQIEANLPYFIENDDIIVLNEYVLQFKT